MSTSENRTLYPIGRVASPLTTTADAPRQGDEGAPAARIVVERSYGLDLKPALGAIADR